MNCNNEIVCDEIVLGPLSNNDLEQLRIWRNDKKISAYLRKIGYIDSEAQKRWYRSEIDSKTSVIFSVYDHQIVHGLIGTVSIYSIDGPVAKIGRIMIGDERAHHRGIGRLSMIMAMSYGFDELGIEKYYGEVHKDNTAAITTYRKIGFRFTEPDDFDEHDEYVISMSRDEFVTINSETLSKIKYQRAGNTS